MSKLAFILLFSITSRELLHKIIEINNWIKPSGMNIKTRFKQDI